jgi:hypothetical protein
MEQTDVWIRWRSAFATYGQGSAVEIRSALAAPVDHFPVEARGREIVTPQGLTIAVASDPAMSEEIVRRLNNSDRSDQEDHWAL